MFSSIRNFLHRHRRKFLIVGTLVGGVTLLSRFAEYKFLQWHDANTRSLIEKQKRRQHYEKTRETANATVLNLSTSLSKILSDELDTDCILQAIRSQPQGKLLCWEDLKLVGFSRCLAVVYTSALVGSFVHVHLMLLGSYTYVDANPKGSGVLVNTEVQERYLNHLQSFVQIGLPQLYNKILKAVKHQVGPLSLNKPVSLEALEGILKDITLLLAGESTLDSNPAFKLNPWSQYAVDYKKNVPNSPEANVLNSITEELVDLVDSDDFDMVVQSLVQSGLNYVLDHVATFYPQPALPEGTISKIDPDKPSELLNGYSISSEQTTEKDLTRPHRLSSSFTKATLPLAKLVPVVSGLVHSSLSPAPGHLLQSTLLNELLENYCFNLYEAFSVKL